MASVGGSIENISISGRLFAIASDSDSNRSLGGFTNTVEANGDGSARIIKTRVPFILDGLSVTVDDTRGDQEFLQELANAPEFFPITITYASGETWQGNSQITGELQFSSQNSTVALSLSGQGNLTKQ